MRSSRCWWLILGGIWALATTADRLWLRLDLRLPAYDQADYLNSAVDHGRALGLLAGGGWQGWPALLDLSPKIPPLASLVNGTVMAVAGDAPDQASWSLALWHGLLLVVVACWARELGGRGFALLAAALLAATPALAALRVDYTLDLPLAAVTSLALWQLGRWQAPAPRGGGWGQALAAALAVASALLVKQSALLVLALPCLWAAGRGLGEARRRAQVLLAVALVLALLLPWLRHNWITTLGGTNRAVLESATAEGDPAPLSLASLLWYPSRWRELLGSVLPLPALAAALGGAGRALRRRSVPMGLLLHPVRTLPPGWPWLLGCLLSGWLGTTLSPNKDLRYIAPMLPLLILMLARGWWQLGVWLAGRRHGRTTAIASLAGGLVALGGSTTALRAEALDRRPPAPLEAITHELRRRVGEEPVTLVVLPSSSLINEHNVTTFGRLDGGRILARRLGKDRDEHPLVLERSTWLLLATGDQGTDRKPVRRLSRRVRRDGRFAPVARWPWTEGRDLELWRRRPELGPAPRFDEEFVRLARGLEQGPAGLAAVFPLIGPEHQLDGHFLYQKRVEAWATERLRRDPDDEDALWSLALLATLRNRPAEADRRFAELQRLHPGNPWPPAYRAFVLMAGWTPWKARAVLAATPEPVRGEPVVRGLLDLSQLLCGDPRAIGSLQSSLPEAVSEVERQLEQAPPPEKDGSPSAGRAGTDPPPS